MDCRVKPGNDENRDGIFMQLNTTKLCIILTLAALALGACASRNDVPVSSLGEDDDAICRANNVAVGSSDYVACRKNRDVQRGNAAARADRAQKNLSETMVNTPYKP
jgi:hypothetical protein